MALLALGSLRSCGVTTTALALARTWPVEHPVMLAEVDPAGGTLAATIGLHGEPGLQSLAAAARHQLAPDALRMHAQDIGGASVLVAPSAAEQVRAALAMLGELRSVLRSSTCDVIADCGRLDVASPVLPLFASSDRALMLVRPELADLNTLVASLERRGLNPDRLGDRLGLIVVGPGPYGADEITEAFGAPVLASLPFDRAGAEALSIEGGPRGLATRHLLLRSARTLAEGLVEQLGSPSDVAVDGATEADSTGELVGDPIGSEEVAR